MIAPGSNARISDSASEQRADEILSLSARTRVFRRFLPSGSLIYKQPLGAEAPGRMRHEKAMLKRVSAVPGVAKLAHNSPPAGSRIEAIALEDNHGLPLALVLKTERLEIQAVLELAVRLAKTLAAIHALGVVHRAVNPANILLAGPQRAPILIDFHLASALSEERLSPMSPGEIAGTLAYIAPEQTGRTGRVTDQRADLYALGVTLYELATGHVPFAGAGSFEVIRDHLARVPLSPITRDPAVPQILSDIIMRLLQKEPDLRYQSATGLDTDLTHLLARRAEGIDAPFALGEGDFPERLLPPSRLAGREAERILLRAAFEAALADKGHCLLLAGAPGVGKTALTNELRPLAVASGGWFARGKFDQHRQGRESKGFSQAFGELFSLLLAEPEEDLVSLRAELLQRLGPNTALAAAVMPGFGFLVGVLPQRQTLEPATARGRIVQTGLDVLKCIASSSRPVVLVVDDLQWAGATALAFIDAVLREASFPGLLLVGAYRPAEIDPAHQLATALARWQRLSVAPRELLLNDLLPSELATLLEAMLRLRPGQAQNLARAVGDRTHGNPYDTVELINTLRHDGVLTAGAEGWTWDQATIRGYVGQGDVLGLLTARIDALAASPRAVLDAMACLGAEVEFDLLQLAGGFSLPALAAWLAPLQSEGLLVVVPASARTVRFRHDRVQQAAYNRLAPEARSRLHLKLARRLAVSSEYADFSAEQYLAAVGSVHDPVERVLVATIFRAGAERAELLANYAGAERFLRAALTLLRGAGATDDVLVGALEKKLHATLYSLGKLKRADVLFRKIERRGGAPLELVDTTCVQISSLTNRNLPRQALDLGLGLLRRIGCVAPERDGVEAAVEGRLDAIYRWCDQTLDPIYELPPVAATEALVSATAKLIARMMSPAFFCDRAILGWLVLESVRLWSEHEPRAALVGPLSHAGFVTTALRGDYGIGYRVAQRVLAASEARGYEPETSLSRFLFALGNQHWFEPMQQCVVQTRLAREGLVRGGDLHNACHTYYASIPLLLECAATVEEFLLEAEAGIAFALRTANDLSRKTFVAYRQLARALRGETYAAGSFTESSFDEEAHLRGLDRNPIASLYFHLTRGFCALVFDETPSLLRHADAAMQLSPLIRAMPSTALAHLVAALSAARRIRIAAPKECADLLAELDRSRDWLQSRADDAPENFLHLTRLIDAERAWAVGDFSAACAGFEAAQRAAQSRRSPSHRALIAERAGLFYLEHALERYGRFLLSDARRLYEAWGAAAKVAQLERQHPFLLEAAADNAPRALATTSVSSDAIDMVGILRASQALSSQTTLELLKARVIELLAELTGATAVQFVLRSEAEQDWFFSPPASPDAAPVTARAAGALGLLPLTVFRYVERTREPLLVEDVSRDDRFARDPYFAGCEQCSTFAVPILSQGEPRAILILENRLGRGAFSAGRLDAVMLIAGQLAVSLDNALLYASLERKVAERTMALGAANEQLARLSLTDALTGLANRRGFDERLKTEWLRALRTGTPLGLGIIDIDDFKKYNDRYGHPAGDACLQRVAQILKADLRPGADELARYGGEEFVFLLPDTGLSGTSSAAERLRASVAAQHEPHVTALHGIVTVSIGFVVFVPSERNTAAEYLAAADVALYEAKRGGRNRVVNAAGTRSVPSANGTTLPPTSIPAVPPEP